MEVQLRTVGLGARAHMAFVPSNWSASLARVLV